jgi:hypothetical protein
LGGKKTVQVLGASNVKGWFLSKTALPVGRILLLFGTQQPTMIYQAPICFVSKVTHPK